MRLATLVAGLALVVAPLSNPAKAAAPVLLISIDGLQPGDVLEADKRGIRVPTLSALVASGAYATGVRNVLPTMTYPNHTTLITGVSPARHGIPDNVVFDPLEKSQGGQYWYASDIKVATLWDAVHAAGGQVVSIWWPVSVGARGVDANIPEYWRTRGDADDAKLMRVVSTTGLAAQLEEATGMPFEPVLNDDQRGDETKARYTAALIEAKHPRLVTLHMSSLDHTQHEHGPNTPEARDALQHLDTDVATVIAAARKAAPDVVVAVVSDHGFAKLEHEVNLKKLFAEQGLLTLDGAGHIKTWDAAPWPAGGSTAVVLAKPDDPALRAKVASVLAELQKRPELGIGNIIDQKEIAARGATSLAAFFIDFKLGYQMGGNGAAEIVAVSRSNGTHGYFPDHPEMHSTFIIAGAKVPKKGSLGEIDMRDIAPTLAKILEVSLPAAEGKPLF